MSGFPPSSILVPFDFSEPSFAAWHAALGWASRFGASVEALHVIPEAPPALPPSAVFPPLTDPRARARTRRQVYLRLTATLGDDARLTVEEGDVAACVLRAADVRLPGLIAMGTHGRTGLSRLLWGSTAEAVVRRSTVPVLAVHRDPGPVRRLLVPVNFTSYSELGFRYAAEAAGALGARLAVLYVADDRPRDPRPAFKALLDGLPFRARAGLEPELLVRSGDAAGAIVAESARHDLTVLVAHRKSIRDLWLGTTAERVLRLAQGPVLAVPSMETVEAPARTPAILLPVRGLAA